MSKGNGNTRTSSPSNTVGNVSSSPVGTAINVGAKLQQQLSSRFNADYEYGKVDSEGTMTIELSGKAYGDGVDIYTDTDDKGVNYMVPQGRNAVYNSTVERYLNTTKKLLDDMQKSKSYKNVKRIKIHMVFD